MGSERPRRTKYPTLRAQEADIQITGIQYDLTPNIDNPPAPSLTSQLSSLAAPSPLSAPATTSSRPQHRPPAPMATQKDQEQPGGAASAPGPDQGTSPQPAATTTEASDAPSQPADAALTAQAQQAASVLVVSQKKKVAAQPVSAAPHSKQKTGRVGRPSLAQGSRSKQAAVKKEAQPKRNASAPRSAVQMYITSDPAIHPNKLMIYPWEVPKPTDFLNLSESRKAWKARYDAAQEAEHDNPDLDDWHEFSGVQSDLFPELRLETSVGFNFISRAKRAFRHGRTWESFEQEELAIDSRGSARQIKDRVEREMAMEYSLSNNLRLYVFEEIKVRLCHEIWLQPYPEPEAIEADIPRTDNAVATAAPTPALPVGGGAIPSNPSEHLRQLNALMAAERARHQRQQPELQRNGRERHQPQGPVIRAPQANMRNLGVTAFGMGMDMETSDEEAS